MATNIDEASWAATSALIVALPDHLAKQIERIRETHDKAFGRWMPHVNIFFPFYKDDSAEPNSRFVQKCNDAQQLLADQQDVHEFMLWFDGVSSFKQPDGKHTVHLVPKTHPEDMLAKLRALLLEEFGQQGVSKKPFVPHMTIGQWPAIVSVADIEKSFADQLDAVMHQPFRVQCLTAISRFDDQRFAPRLRLQLATWEELAAMLPAIEQSATEDIPRATIYVQSKVDTGASSSSSSVGCSHAEPDSRTRKSAVLQFSEHLVRVIIPTGSFGDSDRELVLVCDTSGSMDGIPKKQVLEVVGEISRQEVEFSIINYSHTAVVIPGNREALANTWAAANTNFKQAFARMLEVARKSRRREIHFVFLTDGMPSDKPFEPSRDGGISYDELRKGLRKGCCGKEVVVHSFGLGSGSDPALLEQIRVAGSQPGIYTFATAEKGRTEIVSEMLDIMSCARMQRFEVIVNGRSVGAQEFATASAGTLEAEFWCSERPVTLELVKTDSGECVKVLQVEQEEVTAETHAYHLASVRRRMETISDANVPVRLQQELIAIRSCCRRADRAEVMAECLGLSQELEQTRALLVARVRGSVTRSSETLSRLNAMAFKGQMRKARRARLMDTRMLANKGFLETLDERLAALPQVDAGEMKAEEAAMEETLRDDISQDSLAEILTESREDLLMIGLRVRRSELSLDQPVCIQVELCTTMVSWSTLETAAQFEMARGNSSATGTFDPNQVTRLLTGTSHEPINAGLPVYGCEAHYQRVRVWLPVLCGHFFTLSETGFSPKQVLALYAILARLSDSPAAASQRARVFLAQLSRLLHRIAGDDALLAELRLPADQRPRVLLRRFVTDARSHMKSELPTLDIIRGIIRCLQTASEPLPQALCPVLLAETLRRHMNGLMVARGGGYESFHGMIRRALFLQQPACCPVQVQNPATFDRALGQFTPARFQAYSPLEAPESLVFLEEDLTAAEIPLTAEQFVKKFSFVFPLEDESQYSSCLAPAVFQAAWACHNDTFRGLAESGTALLDPLSEEGVEISRRQVGAALQHFDEERRVRWQRVCGEQVDEETSLALVHDTSLDEFALALLQLQPRRTQRMWTLLADELSSEDTFSHVPDGPHKLAILLFGSLNGQPLVEGGSPWMAGPRYAPWLRLQLSRFPEYAEQMEQLDASMLQHEYRASDQPNRHGHSRSNPLWVAQPLHPMVPLLRRRWDS